MYPIDVQALNFWFSSAGRAPVATVEPARWARTHRPLLYAALNVFATGEVRRATIAKICEHADFTCGAFWSNYASLDDLLLALYIDSALARGSGLSYSLLTLGFEPTRFQTKPPACYRASWQLPGPDPHRQAMTS